MSVKTKGALLYQPNTDWRVEEIEIGDPVQGEVLVRLAASGLCHSDEHARTGANVLPMYPFLGGHEGAGVVTKVGPGVIGIEEGDHVVLTFNPACGVCRPCSMGLQNLCDQGADLFTGRSIADGTYRVTAGGKPVLPACLLGAFSPYVCVNQSSVVKIEKDIDLATAALLGCGVCTGWGSAASIGGTKAGDVVVVVGIGGVGINAVQGAAAAGARMIVAIDPVAQKRAWATEFGATHTFASMAEALEPLRDLSWGTMANTVVLTVGELHGDMLQPALDLTGKAGQVIVTAIAGANKIDAKVLLPELVLYQKRIQGALFGGASPRTQIPKLLHEYRAGRLKLDELTTSTYTLEEINQGYDDMNAGKNLRGVIHFTEADW